MQVKSMQMHWTHSECVINGGQLESNCEMIRVSCRIVIRRNRGKKQLWEKIFWFLSIFHTNRSLSFPTGWFCLQKPKCVLNFWANFLSYSHRHGFIYANEEKENGFGAVFEMIADNCLKNKSLIKILQNQKLQLKWPIKKKILFYFRE